MFFFRDSNSIRMEERMRLNLRNRIYGLTIAIDRDYMYNAAQNGIRLKSGMAEPWYTDFMLVKEMDKRLGVLSNESFLREYGEELERLESIY